MNRIEDLLNEIECKHNVKILYACEAGSRAYGFATESSDYDIRFIYLAPLRDYLSLTRKDDTITWKDDIYDVQGWDLKKALLLAKKFNPSLYEWLLSPIKYRELSPAMLPFKDMVRNGFSQKVLAYHYVNISRKNIESWSGKRDTSNLVHSVRASLMLEKVMHQELKSIELKELIKESRIFNSEELSLIFQLKVGGVLNDDPLINQISAKVIKYLTASEESLVHLREGTVNSHFLEELFFQQLGIEGESDRKK